MSLPAGLLACGEVAAPRDPATVAVAQAPPATPATPAAPATPTAPAAPTTPVVATPIDGCVYTATPAGLGVGGISILGVGDGGGGYDMPDICPVQACSSGLTVQLPKAGDWTYGAYDLTVATDLGTLRCHVTRAAPPPQVRPARCAHERELSYECAGPPDLAMGPIMISGAPTSVRVTIAKDGAVLADATMAPRYSNLRWDGFDCDPSCRAATGTVDVR
ncbi:MAG: hypothetical protein JNK64_31970 [Myxococcales bacterium]|nr:hypothetical protein [Myxococcales bacterium]